MAAVLALGVGTAALTAACAAPTTSTSEVRRQAHLSAEAALSELATVELATRTRLRGDAFWTSTDVTVTASEGALSTVEQTFTSRQPPRPAGPLWSRTGDALARAADVVVDVRVAVRRHDEHELRTLLPDLRSVQRRLETIESETA
jgi:hypothetical protein